MTRFLIENRTGEPVDLAYVDRHVMVRGRLQIAPGAVGTIDGEPCDLAWLNAAEVKHDILPAAVADAIDAERHPVEGPWEGLACRVEAISS